MLVLTPSAIASQYVTMEVSAALHQVQQRRFAGVIPILAAPCVPNSIPAFWDVLHRYDATNGYEAAWYGLLRATGISAQAPASAPAPVKRRSPRRPR